MSPRRPMSCCFSSTFRAAAPIQKEWENSILQSIWLQGKKCCLPFGSADVRIRIPRRVLWRRRWGEDKCNVECFTIIFSETQHTELSWRIEILWKRWNFIHRIYIDFFYYDQSNQLFKYMIIFYIFYHDLLDDIVEKHVLHKYLNRMLGEIKRNKYKIQTHNLLCLRCTDKKI